MKRRLVGGLRRTGAVAALAAVALVGSAGAASAATGGAYASGTGVFGSANWEWTKSGWKNGNAAVRDTACDGEPVFIHFQVRTSSSTYTTPKRWNQQGCGETSSWAGLTYDAGYYVTSVRVVTCVDTGTPRCYYSDWQDNPLT
ncbi:hypothetical protein [Kitasatospora sp. NPDC001547]|uniref:hypothetical protein n=1 Tax=Kitasatospora sp. NPDC001547 TaxID=3364015 RepID=UPI0036783475|nr:hypothetical protein KitaXyl93_75310 [Kitasatospora sp. Xyl93]